MEEEKFDPENLEKLNNPARLKEFPPNIIINRLSLKYPKVIIDIGAGTGFYSVQFAQKFKNSKIYACDISEIMINWMQDNIITRYNNIFPTLMDDNNVPLDSKIADFLFTVNLHHELDAPDKMLNEYFRLLMSDGKIAISDWKKMETESGPPTEYRYEPEEVKSQLMTAGFTNIHIYTDFPSNFLVVGEKSG